MRGRHSFPCQNRVSPSAHSVKLSLQPQGVWGLVPEENDSMVLLRHLFSPSSNQPSYLFCWNEDQGMQHHSHLHNRRCFWREGQICLLWGKAWALLQGSMFPFPTQGNDAALTPPEHSLAGSCRARAASEICMSFMTIFFFLLVRKKKKTLSKTER